MAHIYLPNVIVDDHGIEWIEGTVKMQIDNHRQIGKVRQAINRLRRAAPGLNTQSYPVYIGGAGKDTINNNSTNIAKVTATETATATETKIHRIFSVE